MRVTEVHTGGEFDALAGQWDALLRESARATVFTSWEWMRAWWRAYGKGKLRIALVHDDTNVLRGIAPMQDTSMRRYGQTVPALSFIGDGSCDSDYLDIVIARGWEEPVMTALAGRWERDIQRGTVLVCNAMDAESPSVAGLKELGAAVGHICTNAESHCGTVRLPETWDAFLSTLKPRFRTKVRSSLRNLESRPDMRFGFSETPEQAEQILPALFELHACRWAADGKPGVFGWREKREFYHLVTRLLSHRGWLRFSFLEWRGRILACQYGFIRDQVYFHLQEGYEPASENWSLGIALRAWSIREMLGQGIREYDFLEGIGRHKTDWGAAIRKCRSIQVASRTWKNLVFCRGPEWDQEGRELVKRVIPDRVLAIRNLRGDGAGLRQTVASMYCRLGVPTVIRSAREKYTLSVNRSGVMPAIHWTRRTEPAGRILYYHRVNDENDPFFPAMPVHVFEEQIRFLARHYQVVSLSRMIEGLHRDGPRNELAITFDDGYADNYENALPVLRKYGLPATIFLTTGSIDSRQPLWFEQLALAIKTTPRELLDLEIDVPRRLLMRTQQERLMANDAVFAVLRSLSDADRREWLARILAELGGTCGDRDGRMLTWDQIRQMNTQGIDFGGHTVTHPFVSRMTPEEALWEVSECKRRIEHELQSPVDHFAYPSGREADIGAGSRELLVQVGYRAALTTIWGINTPATDLMQLRRGQPWESNSDMFAYKFDWYQFSNG